MNSLRQNARKHCPSPFSTIPILPDPDFVERKEVFDQIDQRMLAPAARVALVGIGGVG